jgi:hypothetical protein
LLVLFLTNSKYSKPFPLEEFLIPPEGGFDWRLPTEFAEQEWEQYANRSWTQYRNERRSQWHKLIQRPEHNNTRFIFANTNLAINFVGNVFSQETGENLDELWPGIFRRMFKPSKSLGESIDTFAREKGLIPGEFAAAHVRARFPAGRGDINMNKRDEHSGINMNDNHTRDVVTKIGDNAIKCATKAMPGTKYVYFASDSHVINNYLLDESPFWAQNNQTNTTSKNVTVLMRPDHVIDAKHLEYEPTENSKPSDYYATFHDLWIMAHSKCLSQGVGGFGHFGSVLSGNHNSCRVRHRDYFQDGLSLPSCPTPNELRVTKLKDAILGVQQELKDSQEALIKAQEEKKAAEEAKAQAEEEKKGLMEELEVQKTKMNEIQAEEEKKGLIEELEVQKTKMNETEM